MSERLAIVMKLSTYIKVTNLSVIGRILTGIYLASPLKQGVTKSLFLNEWRQEKEQLITFNVLPEKKKK